MSRDSFFRNELHYLHEQSKDFVDEYPQVSYFLSERSTDPDVNRTLDAFAWLSSRLHAKAGSEYPQLTSGLMNMLWPNYLQPTPSITMIEFHNDTHQQHCVVAGSEVLSRTSDYMPIACTFRIARNTWISPFTVSAIHQDKRPNTKSLLIDFSAAQAVNLQSAELNKLRLYCGDDPFASYSLYLWLANYFERAVLVIDGEEYPLADNSLTPVGFKEQESILSYPGNTFSGYRLLQEYFCFPDGFLFFDINGFPQLIDGRSAQQFSLRLEFNRALPVTMKLHKNALKTNCSPAINLFYHDCEPVLLNGFKTQYPLVIDYKNPDSYELFAIDTVTSGYHDNKNSGDESSASPRTYYLFDSFQHQFAHDQQATTRYYHINRVQQKHSDAISYSMSFVRGDEAQCCGKEEVISVRALCTNGDEAQNLTPGDICIPTSAIPAGIRLSNISHPSKAMRPILDGSQHWTTISTLSLNYLSLLNKDALAQILQNYNFTALYSRRAEQTLSKILNSIERFETRNARQQYRGHPIQGHESTIHMSPAAFNSHGELYLFGGVLAHFYSSYATVNSFHILNVVNLSTQEVYRWPLLNQ